jgi:hypothetical protein
MARGRPEKEARLREGDWPSVPTGAALLRLVERRHRGGPTRPTFPLSAAKDRRHDDALGRRAIDASSGWDRSLRGLMRALQRGRGRLATRPGRPAPLPRASRRYRRKLELPAPTESFQRGGMGTTLQEYEQCGRPWDVECRTIFPAVCGFCLLLERHGSRAADSPVLARHPEQTSVGAARCDSPTSRTPPTRRPAAQTLTRLVRPGGSCLLSTRRSRRCHGF